jgi:hypothetical protein
MIPCPTHASQVSPGLWISGIAGLEQIEILKITHIVVRKPSAISSSSSGFAHLCKNSA